MNTNRINSKKILSAAILTAAAVTLSAGCVSTNKVGHIDASKNTDITAGVVSAMSKEAAYSLDKGATVVASDVVAVSLRNESSNEPEVKADESEASAENLVTETVSSENNSVTASTISVSSQAVMKSKKGSSEQAEGDEIAESNAEADALEASKAKAEADALAAEQAEADQLAAQQAQAEADALEATQAAEQAEVDALAAEQAELDQFIAQQAQAEADDLAAQQAAQQAAEAQASSINDQVLLAALIQCEAGNEPYDGQVAVGAVVMNRLNSGYASNIHDVIYQKGQFGPAGRGSVASVAASGPKASCMQAAAEALAGSDPTGGAKSFCRAGRCSGVVIGNHVFY